jgi:serine/threonine-protein kinase
MTPQSFEGQTLGKYRIMEALGRGGMAQVYKAYHPQLDRYVAMKILRSDLVEEEEFVARFQREARAAANLRHVNIVQVFDFDSQDETYFMIMELLEGDTLRARLNEYRVRKQRMPLNEVIRAMRDVLNGLAYAHNEGIIHRDIKPANIMLTKKGDAVITDFGIAQIVGGTKYTTTGALMGTLNYMAPEQGLQGHCDRRSDLYSLGIVFYEMLTGYTPFDADTPLAILMKHLNDPLPLPHLIDPDLPEALERIALKLLAKNPDDRYQTAEEVISVIESFSISDKNQARMIVPPPAGIIPSVMSGTTKDQITDRKFADADTDVDLGSITDPQRPKAHPVSRAWYDIVIHSTAGIFTGVGMFMIANALALMVQIVFNRNVFARGWTIEVALAAGLMGMIAWGTSQTGLFIPGILLLGNAAFLGYTAITDHWNYWIFLGFLEPVIVYLAIVAHTQNMARENADTIARVGGMLLAFVSYALAVYIGILAILVGG